MNRDESKLSDIKFAINKIDEVTSTRKFYELDDIEKYGILYFLQIIGEAARIISNEFKENNKQIPWREIIGFRNFVIHQYMDIKWEIIEKILHTDLSVLKEKIQTLTRGE